MDKLSLVMGGKWLQDLHQDLSGSDRSCAVLAAAILDDRLDRLLKAVLLPGAAKGEDRLLGRGGVADSFSARIELAYRVGLLSANVRKALDWLREIRNEAAHRTEFSFDADAIRSRAKNVVVALELKTRFPRSLQEPYASSKGHFVASTFVLACVLEAVAASPLRLGLEPLVDMTNMLFKNEDEG